MAGSSSRCFEAATPTYVSWRCWRGAGALVVRLSPRPAQQPALATEAQQALLLLAMRGDAAGLPCGRRCGPSQVCHRARVAGAKDVRGLGARVHKANSPVGTPKCDSAWWTGGAGNCIFAVA